MIDCEQALRLSSRESDGEADAGERAALDLHCASCGPCAAVRGELGALRGLIASSLPRPLGDVTRARFAARLAEEQAQERYWDEAGRVARRWTRIAAAAAAVLVVAAGLLAEPSSASVQSGAEVASESVNVQDLILGDTQVTADVAATLTIRGVPTK